MKKTMALAFLLITVLSMGTGFVISRGTQNMSVRMSAKDLPEYGLTIVTPSDPDFDVLAAEHIKDMPAEVSDNIKPLSILIRNKSRRAVVAHAIIWDCVDADGKSQRVKKIYANSEALTDGEEYISALPRTNLGKTISPGKERLFSLVTLPRSARRDGPGGGGSSSHSNSSQVEGDEPSSTEGLAQTGSKWLSKCVELIASIDGVFFDDGSFIGPDEAGLFNQIKSQVEAKIELRREIKEKLTRGTPADEIFKDLASEANAAAPANLASITTSEGHRAYFRKFFANVFLQQSKAYGQDKGLEMALGPMGKGRPEPRLRKLESSSNL
jgi:hypothetical protein